MEHRKGLNRTLFWLYAGNGRWPFVFRWTLLVIDFATIAVFLAHPVLAWHDGTHEATGAWLWADIAIAVFIALDFAARFYIERSKRRFFSKVLNWVDLLVLASVIVPIFFQNFVYLRVLRAIRIVRAFEFVNRARPLSAWLDKNADVIGRVVNLVVFIFIMTALVYANQAGRNDKVASYLDALYFTVTSLTTTGYGDLVLVGWEGRWLSIIVMVLGVTMFLQLIRAIAIGDKLREPCPKCNLSYHDRDALHCKRCGHDLFEAEPTGGDAHRS